MIMYNRNISAFLLTSSLLLIACNSEDQQKPADIPRDSVAVAPSGNGSSESTKHTDTATSVANAKKDEAIKDLPKKATETVKTATEKVKSSANAPVDATKKIIHKTDSAVSAKKDEAVASAKKEISKATDDNLLPATTADNTKSFAPKYGIIPRDANENNISSFKNAFPDKRTLVKINFDAEPDAEMQSAKTQIINALKKAGYSNVSDKSQVFHPTRMPKEIHYELQRDGSVIIWLQPVSAQ